ncbi:PIG-L deacetylase family protein [Flavitalea sp.]|nr:PIG-L family deacetylase [Flavitalea sp.]
MKSSNLAIFALGLVFSLLQLSPACIAQDNKVILAIFAHPDDESTVSPVLAKYAAEGAAVYIAVATDGRYGFTPHFGMKNPDSLAIVRAAEMNCLASTLGINKPIIMGLHDQMRMKEGMDSLGSQLGKMRNRIIMLFNELKPDLVITWGSSGLTGHPDHRSVSDVVTEVFAMKRWAKPVNLYYTEVPSGSITGNNFYLATVDSSYLNVRVTVSPAELQKARTAWDCHKSQYTKEGIDELQRLFWNTKNGNFYFRSYRGTEIRKTGLFDEIK